MCVSLGRKAFEKAHIVSRPWPYTAACNDVMTPLEIRPPTNEGA